MTIEEIVETITVDDSEECPVFNQDKSMDLARLRGVTTRLESHARACTCLGKRGKAYRKIKQVVNLLLAWFHCILGR